MDSMFGLELKALLEKYGATIEFRCTDMRGIRRARIVIADACGDELIESAIGTTSLSVGDIEYILGD